jgi:hypothetical protein
LLAGLHSARKNWTTPVFLEECDEDDASGGGHAHNSVVNAVAFEPHDQESYGEGEDEEGDAPSLSLQNIIALPSRYKFPRQIFVSIFLTLECRSDSCNFSDSIVPRLMLTSLLLHCAKTNADVVVVARRPEHPRVALLLPR